MQVLQLQLHLSNRYKVVNEKCLKLLKANDALRSNKTKLDKALKDVEHKTSALEDEVKRLKNENDKLIKESLETRGVVVEQEQDIAALKGQLASIA